MCWPHAASKSAWDLTAWTTVVALLAPASAALLGSFIVPSEVRLPDATLLTSVPCNRCCSAHETQTRKDADVDKVH